MSELRDRLARLREGEFKAGTHRVYFQNKDTLRDAADLYAVLAEQADNGSPNLENEQAKGMIETLQQGKLLDGDQLNRLLELVKKYAADLAEYRASDDHSQDILAVPSKPADTARILS